MTADRIRHVALSSVVLPLPTPISDAKVLTGRQKPMTEVVLLFAEITTDHGQRGTGFSYSKRAGGPAQFAHAKEVAEGLLGEDPSDIAKVYDKLLWAGASVGRSGVATQALAAIDIALWDLKARRADLPLSKLIGSHRDSVRTYNTSGGLPPRPGRGGQGARVRVARGRHRRHQDQGRPARHEGRPPAASPPCASTSATTCR